MENKSPNPSMGYQKKIKKDEAGMKKPPKPKAAQSTDYSSPTAKKWPLFIEAIEKGNVDIVNQLIEEGINVNVVRDESTPLMIAASRGRIEIAETMLQAGANINEKNHEGWTALHKAAHDQNETDIVQFLMDSGIDIESKTRSGKTALMLAEEKGHRDIVRVIKIHLAKLQADAQEWEAFLNSAEGKPYRQSRRYDSLTLLFRFWWLPLPVLAGCGFLLGILLNRTVLAGLIGTVTGIAATGFIFLWNRKLRSYLDDIGPLPYMDIHIVRQKRKAGESILSEKKSETSSMEEKAELTREVVSEGTTSPSSFDSILNEEQNNARSRVLKKGGNLKIVIVSSCAFVLLVLVGAGFAYKDDLTKWYFAKKLEQNGIQLSEQSFLTEVAKNNAEALDLFIKAGVNTAAKNDKGQTALIISSEKGYVDILQKLLTVSDASLLNMYDTSGNTALMAAAREGNESVVQRLLESGADVNYMVPSREGAISALQAVLTVSDFKDAHMRILSALILRGAKIGAKDSLGRSTLLVAAERGRTEAAKLLIEKGADVNGTDTTGNFPLLSAACKGFSGMVTLLVEQKADVQTALPDGKNPLMCAAEQGHADTVIVLLSKGANIDAKDAVGSTALAYAVKAGYIDVIKLLLARGAGPVSGYIPESYANLKGKAITISAKRNKISDILGRIAKTASQDGYTVNFSSETEKTTTVSAKGPWNKVLSEFIAKNHLLLVVKNMDIFVLPYAK
jgi:ankyrin repeat protein